MSTRCNIEFYYDYETVDLKSTGEWTCTCENFSIRGNPDRRHIQYQKSLRAFNPPSSYRIIVPSHSRPGKYHTVTYAKPVKSRYQKLAARIYQHSDGYPSGIIPQLRRLEDVVSGKNQTKSIYGPRTDGPEWSAAEFINMFRQPGNGNIYVSQNRHGDIAYLYKIYCRRDSFEIKIFERLGEKFREVAPKFNLQTGEENA